MRKNIIKFNIPLIFSLILIVGVALLIGVPALTPLNQNALIQISVENLSSGSEPFDVGASCENFSTPPGNRNYTPGQDGCASDAIARTRDTVAVKFTTSFSYADLHNIRVSSVLADGYSWTRCPIECSNQEACISADKRTLTCNLGNVSSTGTGSEIKAFVGNLLVNRKAQNNSQFLVEASISSDENLGATSNQLNYTVSAYPRFDINKRDCWSGAYARSFKRGPQGEPGWMLSYPIHVMLKGNKGIGHEYTPDGSIDIVDDISGLTANTKLMTWDGLPTCGYLANGQAIPTLDVRVPGPMGGGTGSAKNSGDFTCTQPGGPGTPINIKIRNADLEGANDVTDFPYCGKPDWEKTVVSGIIRLWVPVSDVVARGGEILAENKYTTITYPSSLSGVVAQEIDYSNNAIQTLLKAGDGVGGGKHYYFPHYYLYPSLRNFSGDMGTRNEVIIANSALANYGTETWSNVILCDKINTNQVSYQGALTPESTVCYGGDGGSSQAVIEYGVNRDGSNKWNSPEEYNNATCFNEDADWYSNVADIPGGFANVTRVRLRYDQVTPGNNCWLSLEYPRLKVLPTVPTGTVLYNRTVLTYDLGKEQKRAHFGDTALVVETAGSIVKENTGNVLENGSKILRMGETTEFVLKPYAVSFEDAPQGHNYTVVDILPAGLQYLSDGAAPTPASVQLQNDGSTKITWEFSGIIPSAPEIPFAEIRFRALAWAGSLTGSSYINCAEVRGSSFGADPSQTNGTCENGMLTDGARVSVIGTERVSVVERTTTPLIYPNENMEFVIGYQNFGPSQVNSGSLITVVPFNGDGAQNGPDGDPGTLDDYLRIPPSSFNGSLKLQSFSGNNGETFLCTTKNPSLIDRDPRASSNQPGGSTLWCGCGTVLNGCIVNPEDSTAIMINFTNLPSQSSLREVSLVYKSLGNTEGNLYTSDTGIGVAELSLAAVSNPATVRVRSNPKSGIIGDRVWYDLDEDGVQDEGEPGIAGVTVYLYDASSQQDVLLSTVTDDNGYYHFTDLNRALDYFVTIVMPSGYIFSPVNTTTDDKDSDLDPQTGRTHTISILAGDDITIDVGLIKRVVETPVPTVTVPAPTPTQIPGCDGIPGSGKIVDICGVCGGDGSTCVPNSTLCTQNDITSKLFALDGVTSKSARITKAAIKKIIKKASKKDRNSINALKKLMVLTDRAGFIGWQYTWGIGQTVLTCPAEANCLSVSFGNNKNQVQSSLDEILANSKLAIKYASKLKVKDRNILKTLKVTVVNAVKDGLKILSEIPNGSFRC